MLGEGFWASERFSARALGFFSLGNQQTPLFWGVKIEPIQGGVPFQTEIVQIIRTNHFLSQRFPKNSSFWHLWGQITSSDAWCTRTCPNPQGISPIAWRRHNLDVSFVAPELNRGCLFSLEPSMAESDWPYRLQCATKPQGNCQDEPQQGENGTMEKRMEKSAWRFAWAARNGGA